MIITHQEVAVRDPLIEQTHHPPLGNLFVQTQPNPQRMPIKQMTVAFIHSTDGMRNIG